MFHLDFYIRHRYFLEYFFDEAIRSFDSVKDLIYNLGNFLFEYNHLRRHGGIDYQTPYE